MAATEPKPRSFGRHFHVRGVDWTALRACVADIIAQQNAYFEFKLLDAEWHAMTTSRRYERLLQARGGDSLSAVLEVFDHCQTPDDPVVEVYVMLGSRGRTGSHGFVVDP